MFCRNHPRTGEGWGGGGKGWLGIQFIIYSREGGHSLWPLLA
jgi:hypothetical protein